jgi:hypothetical protein
MDILELKKTVFSDLVAPLDFLLSKGFKSTIPDNIREYKNGQYYFYTKTSEEWSVTTPPVTVLASSINIFNSEDHSIRFECPKEWADNAEKMLKEVLRNRQTELTHLADIPFEQLWKRCTKPKFQDLEIRARAFSRKKKQFINMYNKQSNEEITGMCQLTAGSRICANIRFMLTEIPHVEGGVDLAIRPIFGAGIQVICLKGLPTPIKRHWDWSEVDFESLSVPLFQNIVVKTPALTIENVEANKITLATNQQFQDRMNVFHEKAGAAPWDGVVFNNQRKQPEVGATAIASLIPKRNNTCIQWSVEYLYQSRKKRQKKETVAQKDNDNMDSSSGNQTKRQCI